MIKINVNYNTADGLAKAERAKTRAENKGLTLMDTIKTGFDKYTLIYK